MRVAPARQGKKAFQNIGMVDGHQQGADRGCVLTWPADAFPTTWDPGPGSPVQGRCLASSLPANFPSLQVSELSSALE